MQLYVIISVHVYVCVSAYLVACTCRCVSFNICQYFKVQMLPHILISSMYEYGYRFSIRARNHKAMNILHLEHKYSSVK